MCVCMKKVPEMELHIQITLYILISLASIKSQQTFPYNPIANISTTWINNPDSVNFAISDQHLKAIIVRPIPSQNLAYACGFINIGPSVRALFSVYFLKIIDSLTSYYEYRIVWSANRNNPVNTDAVFELSPDGNMILKDEGGEVIWSTNTTGMSVKGLNLTESGNLVLFDANNNVVWQSFDHPTDSLLPKQRLKPGEKLIASVSDTNPSEGLYSYTPTNDGILLYFGTQVYHHHKRKNPLENESLRQLGWDGHLREFKLDVSLNTATDILADELSICGYPNVCGEYGVCQNGQCSCPECANSSMTYFIQTRFRKPNLGCSLITPLDCNASHLHSFIEVVQASYFTFRVDISNTDSYTCKKACLANCSCKAAIFRHGLNSSIGDCYLPFMIYSLMSNSDENSTSYSLSIYLKVVQTAPNRVDSRKNYVPMIIVLTFGVLFVGGILSALIIIIIRKKMWHGEVDEDDLDSLPTIPARYSFKDLKIATQNFSMKLGEGGSGSVYKGSLKDGTEIAVKYLDGLGHIDKSFLTEIRSIGNVHHVNLASVVGYCADKSRRLLVYEYMANGSLDNWLDNGRQNFPLDWNQRKNIVIGIAKGLAYLHEDCRQKIIHLDVKPGNILLDENLNAKLSDFGLSKLLSRGQRKVVTTLRGTPGYMAPEWLSCVITEKVDVYSFGVVIMEIICGRKVLDESQHKDRIHLLSVFSRKAKEMKLLDMVDEFCNDIQSHRTEVMKMMQVAAWCLQNEFSVRPSMSYVVKVLEGIIDVDLTHLVDVSHVFPSILSGPR